VKKVDGKMQVLAGKPLTKTAMIKIIGAVNIRHESVYFNQPLIDPRLLSMDPLKFRRHIIWYDKPMVRELLFTKDMKIKTGHYSTPGFLYFLHLGKLRVFAIKNAKVRPGLNTKLYYAPLFNTVGDFGFCWGSVRARTDDVEAIDAEMFKWEEFLWNSKWSHSHKEYEKLYKATENGKKSFNTRKLVSTGMTLKSLINKYL
jgi:PRTRC genetic system protein B